MPEIKITKSNSAIVPQSIAPRQVPQREAVPIRKPHPLRIERIPDILQWWDEEAELIQDLSKNWDWRVDTRDRKVRCGLQLLALAEAVCSRAAAKGARGGEA